MFDSSSCEYVIRPPKKTLAVRSAIFWGAYLVVFALCFSYFCLLWMSDPEHATGILVPYFTLVVLILGTALFLTHRYVRYEYEIALIGGEFSLSKIYGGRSRRVKVSLRFSAVILAACPEKEAHRQEIARYAPDIEYAYALYPDSPDAFFLLFENEDERRCVLYFDTTPESRKAMKHANPAAVKLS